MANFIDNLREIVGNTIKMAQSMPTSNAQKAYHSEGYEGKSTTYNFDNEPKNPGEAAFNGSLLIQPNSDKYSASMNGSRYITDTSLDSPRYTDIIKYRPLLDKIVDTYAKIPTISGRTKLLEYVSKRVPRTPGVQLWMVDFLNSHDGAIRQLNEEGTQIDIGNIVDHMKSISDYVYNRNVQKG